MTWNSHRIVTFTTVFLVTGNIWYAVSGMLGSTFPDRVEQFPFGNWRRNHRKGSHWFVWYALLVVLSYLVPYVSDSVFHVILFLRWFLTGCLAHIIEDSVCGRVPLFRPGKPCYVVPRLFYTGGMGETLFVFSYVLLSAGLWLVVYG